jgi:hypothetical protein
MTMTMVITMAMGMGMAEAERSAAADLGAVTQGQPPVVRTEVDTTAITLGDRVYLTVTVEHDAGTTVIWPDSLDLGPFEVLGATVQEPERLNGRLWSGARLTLTAFQLGELEIPSFAVRVVGPDSTSASDLSTRALSVSVASVGRDESGDIREIKDPLSIPRNWLLLWPWAVGAAGLAAIYWLFRRYRASRQPVTVQVSQKPARPPHELAYEALDRLEQAGHLDRGEIKTHYIEVSDIIRTYIEGRYGVEAMEMATYEVMDGLERVELTTETRQEFEWFFDECDLVKFAKLVPDPMACRAIVPAARRLIDATKRAYVEPPNQHAGVGVQAEATSPESGAVAQ